MTAPETGQGRVGGEVDVAGLRELLAASTPGPWSHGHQGLQGGEVIHVDNLRVARVYKSGWPDYLPDCENAALIAAAVNALPALLDLAERVRVVEGERDAAGREIGLALQMHDVQYARANREQARAESAEAAHAALRAGVEALCELVTDGQRPYAIALDDDVILAVDTDALRALLDGSAS